MRPVIASALGWVANARTNSLVQLGAGSTSSSVNAISLRVHAARPALRARLRPAWAQWKCRTPANCAHTGAAEAVIELSTTRTSPGGNDWTASADKHRASAAGRSRVQITTE